MKIYFIILALLIPLSLSDTFKSDRFTKICFIAITFFVLLLFAGLRSGDQDYSNYVSLMKEITEISNVFKVEKGTSLFFIEPGFRLLVKLIGLFFKNPVLIFLTIAFVSLRINFSCYKKYSPYLLLTVVWYFVHTFLMREMLQIRAGLACAICLYSLRYVEKKSFAKFACCILIAASMHAAAFIFFMAYVFYQFRFSRKQLLLFFVAALLVATFFPLGQLLSNVDNMKITLYFNSEEYNKPLGLFRNPTIWKSVFFAAIGWVYYDRMKKKLPSFELLYHTYFISVVWLFLFNDFSIVAARVATFFSITEVILCPSYLLLFKNGIDKHVGWLVIILVSALILMLNLRTGNVLEYKSIL